MAGPPLFDKDNEREEKKEIECEDCLAGEISQREVIIEGSPEAL